MGRTPDDGVIVTRHSRQRRVAVGIAGSAVCLVTACSISSNRPLVEARPITETPAKVQTLAPPRTPTIVAVGDISPPVVNGQRKTSDLAVHLNPTRVLVLGDEQYPRGALRDFQRYYGPTWGRLNGRTHPVPGNHEYMTPGAAGYFKYFGARARPRGQSYYSVDLDGWHLIALDSNIGRDARSAQVAWLHRDLRATKKRCVLAFWHHPRFSSGARHGSDDSVAPFWRQLYGRRADLVLNGHEHHYERFARQTPTARASPGGIREFVVGTGGNSHYPFGAVKPNSERRIGNTYGVLVLVLHPASYEWRFVAVGGRVLDRGGPERCH
jgi:calcineurin-like phosphoesterase family protein